MVSHLFVALVCCTATALSSAPKTTRPRGRAVAQNVAGPALSPAASRARASVDPTTRTLARSQAPRRRALRAAALSVAAVAAPALALEPPQGCVWTGEGEYPGRKSGADVRLINANLDCNANFVKGFGVSELIVTPAILGLAAVLNNFRSAGDEDRLG
mmetsp:Transcript_25256/g.75838  ORF Transcript_25256/g.75838 Transcript_25256/m.75838 type:complete len:158 (+) Transcript_25256:97-570(+)